MSQANILRLNQASKGQFIQLTSINLEGVMRRRLLDLGFIPGAVVEVVRKSPLGDPIAFRVSQTTVALRREESSKIGGVLLSHEA
ncbi:ferrous iron transport protein A [Fictibacillus macauensis ZFHKF-1]|uniref:Ferrous iron transport protein A n=1 Tax=Fictibacillus macauensis ZFHKF-1 TaxID=1196324 RepID=I8AJM7_9BACL|nr:ferrous iron transport protein A [Fictibacillus macauensis]EIT85972.1 ferrous iron transport protein A [Fictibacillus macauensis ZFHKF-1]